MEPRPLVVAALVAAWLAPRRVVEQPHPICMIRRLTGRQCPACGLTRSWRATLHLRPVEAFRQHPLGPATVVAAAWYAATPDADARLAAIPAWVRLALVAAWIGAWLVRLRPR